MNVAILLKNNLDFSQLSFYASMQINRLLTQNPEVNLITSCLNSTPQQFKVPTANVPITELNVFDGLIISTSIDTTLFAKNLVRKNDIIHYVWDLEWLRRGNKNYFHNIDAYRDVILATRSQSYAVELMKYSGVMTKLITPNFNIASLLNGYRQYRQQSTTDVSGR